MQIQFPRRIQLGFRPWYGLTLRQLAYLVVAGVAAGAIVLFGSALGGDFIIRVIIGLVIISIGVALAFFRKDGMTAEQWLVTRIKFLLRPQKRVWTRGEGGPRQDAEILLDQPMAQERVAPVTEEFPSVRLLRPTPRAATENAAVIVLLDMALLLVLFALAVYLSRGGLAEIQRVLR